MRCRRYYKYNWFKGPQSDFLVDELDDNLTDENGDFLIS